jgi:hypothetical protein
LGRFSVAIHWIAGVWLMATSLIFFFPTESPITAQNMNYAVVVVGVVAIVGVVYWWYWARFFFRGPLREGTQPTPASPVLAPQASPPTVHKNLDVIAVEMTSNTPIVVDSEAEPGDTQAIMAKFSPSPQAGAYGSLL